MIKRENTSTNTNYNNKNLQLVEHVVDNLDQLDDILQNTTNENIEQKSTNEFITDSKTKDHIPIKNNSSEDFSKATIIKTTQLTRKRYKRNIKQKVNRTLNVTNLNILFDSSHINENSNESLEKTPKSRLCNKETTTNNVSFIQSDDFETKTNCITDTPKLRSRIFQVGYDNANDPKFLSTSSSKSQLLNENAVYIDSNVNLNPYLKERDIKLVHKDNSLDDISFFSKDLHKVNLASTPILIKDLPIKDYPNNWNNTQNEKITNIYNNSFSSTTINSRSAAASSKFDYNQSNCYNKTFIQSSLRTFYPKTYLDRVRLLSKNISKSNLKLRSYSLDTTARCKTSPLKETLVDKFKKISTTVLWTCGLFGLCAYIGILLRKKISSICGLDVSEKTVNHRKSCCKSSRSSSLSTCRSCEIFKAEVNLINSKLDQLQTDVSIIKKQMFENNVNQIKQLENKLYGLKNECTDLKSIKSDLKEIKVSINQMTTTNTTTTTSLIGSVPVISSEGPPLPPPPPPPLPMLPLNNPLQNQLKITKKTNKKTEQRPVITLDDILKVKLKKTAERSTLNCKNITQPSSSTDFLHKVKLRSAEQPQSASINYDGDPKTSSPKLIKILSDTPVRKAKPIGEDGEGERLDMRKNNGAAT